MNAPHSRLLLCAFPLLLSGLASGQCITGFNFSEAIVTEDTPCALVMRTPISAHWARAEWQQPLPDQFVFEVDLSRPNTDTGCDTSGFLIGAPSDALGGAVHGIRVLGMSTSGWAGCSTYLTYLNPGRLVVEPASNPALVAGNEWIIEDVPNWTFNQPLRIRIEYDGATVSVSSDGVPLGSFPYVLNERTLTLVAFDEDDVTSYENMTVTAPAPGSPYCFGDGSSLVCPCGAGDAGAGCPNSVGGGAQLAATGTASLGADTFALTVSGLPASTPGLLFRADNQASLPFGAGILCATGGIARGLPRIASSQGIVECTDFRGGPFGGVANVGTPTQFQYWYRDPSNSCGGSPFNTSNGWVVQYQP